MASLHPLHRPLGTQWPHHLPDHVTGSDTVSFTFTTKHTVRNGEGSSDSRMLDDQFCSLSPHCWGICLLIWTEGGYRNASHCTESQMRAEWESGVRGRATQAAVFPAVQLLGTVGQGHSIPGFLRWTPVWPSLLGQNRQERKGSTLDKDSCRRNSPFHFNRAAEQAQVGTTLLVLQMGELKSRVKWLV